MRHPHHIVSAGLLALALVAAPARAQRQDGRPSAPANPGRAAMDSGYSSREPDFVVGHRVYLRSTKTFIGTIRKSDDAHPFPPDRFPRAKMKAVLIERRDGPRDWVPVEGIGRIYVVK